MESCRLVVVGAIPEMVLPTVNPVWLVHLQVTIRHIVKSVRLVTTALEEYVLNVILEPSLLLVLGIVLHAVVDTSVMVINA